MTLRGIEISDDGSESLMDERTTLTALQVSWRAILAGTNKRQRADVVQEAATVADQANLIRSAGTWTPRVPKAEERGIDWYAKAIEYYLTH